MAAGAAPARGKGCGRLGAARWGRAQLVVAAGAFAAELVEEPEAEVLEVLSELVLLEPFVLAAVSAELFPARESVR